MKKTLLTGIAALALAIGSQAQIRQIQDEKVESINFSVVRECIEKAKQIEQVPDSIANLQEDYWQSPKETDSLKRGDSNDIAIYLYDLFKKNGINSEISYGKFNKSEKYKNIWVEFKSNNKNNFDFSDTTYIVNLKLKNSILFRDNYDIEGTIANGSHEIFKYNDHLDKKINEYYNRNGERLMFTNRWYAGRKFNRK